MTKEQFIAHAKEQEARMQQVLDAMADAVAELDAPKDNMISTSAYIDYDEQDVFNALLVFNSVGCSYAIKHGFITNDNVHEKMDAFREMIKSIYGIDTVDEAKNRIMINKMKSKINEGRP